MRQTTFDPANLKRLATFLEDPSCALSGLGETIETDRKDSKLLVRLDGKVLFHIQADEGNLMLSYPLAFAKRGSAEYQKLLTAALGVYVLGNKTPTTHVTFDQDETHLMVGIYAKLPAGCKVTRGVINNMLLEMLYVGGQVNEVLLPLFNQTIVEPPAPGADDQH